MFRVLHTGFDSLDVSFMGALPRDTLAMLAVEKKKAQETKQDRPVEFGKRPFKGVLKSHGMSGGYTYVLTDSPTGAIYSIKDSTDIKDWNLSVSVRALGLLTRGYGATRDWIFDTLKAMDCTIVDHSVRRLDFAVDIHSPGFALDTNGFVTPPQAKIGTVWESGHPLEDDGNKPSAVLRGRNIESVTIGKMPGRQLIAYNKRRAAIDLQTPWWFEVWGIDKDDPLGNVHRIEVRAGRDALAKRLLKRRFDMVEAEIGRFVASALDAIRYVTDKDAHKNITRTTLHPIWALAQEAAKTIPFDSEPILLESRALEIIRQQRREMSIKQAYGNLINALALDGLPSQIILNELPDYARDLANVYTRRVREEDLLKKIEQVIQRQSILLPAATK